MIDCTAVNDALVETSDPRLDRRYIWCHEGTADLGSVLLVGVVHDHPASEYRVRRVLELGSPDILALELPPLAVELFRLYARDPEVPPQLGGEMSIAIQGTDASVVGIDAPNRQYLSLLVKRWLTRSIPTDLLLPTLKDFLLSSTHAVTARLGASVGSFMPAPPRLYDPIRYECSQFDPADSQASHEADHLSMRESFVNAVKLPPSLVLIDDLREESMIQRIRQLRRNGDIMVVLGMEHLDSVNTGITQ